MRARSPLVLAASLALLACTTAPPLPRASPTSGPTNAPTAAPTAPPTNAPTAHPPIITGDQPRVVTGDVTYTNAFFTEGVAEPLIILEDQGGFVTRNRNFEISEESQVIGQITSDFFTSPFSYTLNLPQTPTGSQHDVDHDGTTDPGVQVYAVAYWTNIWGDPYLELRDQGGGGWSTAYASTKVSDAAESYLEVFGGKYLVWAPDGNQMFPSGFGTDNRLFTDDDPLMALQAGWSVVDLDQSPFALSRDVSPVIDLYEPESTELDDFSQLSYADAFDAMVEKFSHEYAFTDLKGIDWDAKAAEFRPAFVAAEGAHDAHAYALALRDFLWSIPDAHIGFDDSLLDQDFVRDTAGGVGLSMVQSDDGAYLVNYVTQGGPADDAGILVGAEIVSLDGQPTDDVVGATVPWSSPFSNPQIARLQQARYALRFPLARGEVAVAFQNPGQGAQNASLPVVAERDSFGHSSTFFGVSDTVLPVEFGILPSGLGYISINSFFDNQVLTIQLWERAITYLNSNRVPGLVLDMRHNGGGSGWLADQMAAYFFDHRVAVGNTARYDPVSDDFYYDPTDQEEMIPPRRELQYNGSVVILIGPGCASACEFFSYDMTLEDRAAIVGQYPSDGAGGSVEQFVMPAGIFTQLTIGRALDANGDIHLEGRGVSPTVQVPISVETIFAEAHGNDPVLDAGVTFLAQQLRL